MSVGEPEEAKALESFGHEVVRLTERETTPEGLRDAMASCDVLLVNKFRIKATPDERLRLMEEFRASGKRVLTWIHDLYMGL